MSGRGWILRILQRLLPPPAWRLPVFAVLGLAAGVGGVVFWQSRAWSYLLDDPKVCINCHIMMPQYATWQHSSHARVATCNDCHVPHDNLLRKYYFKARDGSRHAALFTLRLEEQAIRATPASQEVVQDNCVRCHGQLNDDVHTAVGRRQVEEGQGRYCWECHREVPHGRVRSLSAVPNALMQLESPRLPAWLVNDVRPSNLEIPHEKP